MWLMPLHLHINQKSDYDLINYDFSTKTYVVGSQKNHLIIMFKLIVKKILTFLYAQNISLPCPI